MCFVLLLTSSQFDHCVFNVHIFGSVPSFYPEPQERRPRNNRREWEHKNVDHGTAEQQQQQQSTFHKSGTLESCFEVRQDYNLLLLSLFFTGLFGQMKTWLWKLRLLLLLFFFCDGKLLGHAGGHSVFISSNVPFLQSGRIYQSLALWKENSPPGVIKCEGRGPLWGGRGDTSGTYYGNSPWKPSAWGGTRFVRSSVTPDAVVALSCLWTVQYNVIIDRFLSWW